MYFLIGYWSFSTKNTRPIAELSDNQIFEKSKKFKKGFLSNLQNFECTFWILSDLSLFIAKF